MCERLFQNICPPLLQMSLWVACLLSPPPRKMALTLRSSAKLTNVLFNSILGGHQGQKNLFLEIDSTEGNVQKGSRGVKNKITDLKWTLGQGSLFFALRLRRVTINVSKIILLKNPVFIKN